MSHSNADSKFIWMEGKLIPYAEAQVHVLSHTLHYGTGAFEGIRAYQTKDGRTAIFCLDEHLKRFFDSIRVISYSSPFTLLDYKQACCEVIRANGFKECYLRPLAYMDDSVRGLKLPPHPVCRTAIAAWPWGKYMGDSAAQKGVRIMTSTYRRADAGTALPEAKITGCYITPVLARREATLAGFDEALLLDQNGMVAEGSGENLFLVKDGTIFTPPPGSILPGITRHCVMELARHLKYKVVEAQMTRNQVYLADELFFTGTAVEVTPIREVDNHAIGAGKPGPVTTALSDLFFKVVRGEAPEFSRWLTYV